MALLKRPALAAAVMCLALVACAPFPEVGLLTAGDGTPPALLPIDTLLAQGATPPDDPGPAVASRAAGLKARAAGN